MFGNACVAVGMAPDVLCVRGCVRFCVCAGEACNTDLNPCVHGAMDSAQIATVSLLLALKAPALRARL